MIPSKINLLEVLAVAAPIVASLINKAAGVEDNTNIDNIIRKEDRINNDKPNNIYINIVNNYYVLPDDRIIDSSSEISRKALEALSDGSHYDV